MLKSPAFLYKRERNIRIYEKPYLLLVAAGALGLVACAPDVTSSTTTSESPAPTVNGLSITNKDEFHGLLVGDTATIAYGLDAFTRIALTSMPSDGFGIYSNDGTLIEAIGSMAYMDVSYVNRLRLSLDEAKETMTITLLTLEYDETTMSPITRSTSRWRSPRSGPPSCPTVSPSRPTGSNFLEGAPLTRGLFLIDGLTRDI